MADKTSGSQQKVDESERSEFEDEGKVNGRAADVEKSSGRVFAETPAFDEDKAVPYSRLSNKPAFAREKEDDFEKKKGEEKFSDGADAAAEAIPFGGGYRDQNSRNASQQHQPGPPAPSSSLPRPPAENPIELLTREFVTFRHEMTNEIRQVREDNSVLRNEIRQFMQALAPRNAVSGQQPIGDMSGRSVASYGGGLESDSRNGENAVRPVQPGNGSGDREEQQPFRDVQSRSVASHGGSLESDGSNQESGAVARRGNGDGDGEDDPNASGPNSPKQP